MVIYVSSTSTGGFNGTRTAPYGDLATALAAAQMKYVTIYLLAGIHLISPLSSTSAYYGVRNHVTGTTDNLFSSIGGVTRILTTIRTFYCTMDKNPQPQPECATDRATLIYNNQPSQLFAQFLVNSTLVIQDVIISGEYSLVPSCTINPCNYCPTITKDIYGNSLDDHGNKLVMPYPTTQCAQFNTLSLFTVQNKGLLNLTNVNISYFGQQFLAIITTAGGSLVLNTVNFEKNYVYPNGKNNAIIQQTSCTDYTCGSFVYNGGSVTLLNNGYEYTTNIITKGFVYADGWTTATISNVVFSYNFLAGANNAQENNQLTNSLFYMKKFLQVQLIGCTFNANFGNSGVVLRVFADQLTFAMNYNTNTKQLTDYYVTHIIIQNCVFTNNAAITDGGLIDLEYDKDLQNVLITGCTFTNNLVRGSGIVKFKYDGPMQDEFTIGKTATVQINGTRITGVVFPPRTFTIASTTFTSNYNQGTGVVYFQNAANVVFTSVTFNTCGEPVAGQSVTFQTLTLALFISNPDAYVKTAVTTASQSSCTAVVQIDIGYSFKATGVVATTNLCKLGTAGIVLNQLTSAISLTTCTFSTNTGSDTDGSVLVVASDAPVTIDSTTFQRNTNTLKSSGGTVSLDSFQSSSKVTITSSTFSGNTANKGAGVYSQGSDLLSISSSTFTSNVSLGRGGAVSFQPRDGSSTSSLTIATCTFTSNSSTSENGGAVNVSDPNLTASHITFSVTGCTFASNSVLVDGAAIYIDSSVALSTTSVITATSFTSHSVGNMGTIYTAFWLGTLIVSSVTFSQNKADIGACLYSVHSGGSVITFTSVTMTQNSGYSQIDLADSTIMKIFTSSKLTCKTNSGVCMHMNAGKWTDQGSTYYGNSGQAGGVLYATGAANVTMSGANIYQNKGLSYGGAVHLSEISFFTCTSCTFTTNSATYTGGAIFIEQDSYLKLDTCVLTSNSAIQGSALYFLGSNVNPSLVTSTQFSGNYASKQGTIMMLASTVTFSNSQLFSNTADGDTAGIVMTMSTLNISSSSFHDQTSNSGCFLFTTTNGQVTISNSQFLQCSASVGGGAVFAITSTLSISGSTFSSLNSPIGGAISIIVQCVLILSNVQFASTTASVSGGGIYGFQSSLDITGSTFTGNTNGAVSADKMVSISITSSNFADGSNSAGGALSITRCLQLKVSKSTFSSNSATSTGGAVYLSTNADFPISANYTFFNNTFQSNTAPGAGAFYSNDVSVDIQQNYFYNNSATGTPATVVSSSIIGNGGGVMFDCLDFTTCAFNLTNSTFQQNSATGNGGAVYWRLIMPNLTGTIYVSNTAKYAGNVASFPVSLQAVTQNGTLDSYSGTRRGLSTPIATSITSVAPGQQVNSSLTVALVDHFGNIVTTDNSSPAELQASDSSTQLSGTTKVTAINGIFNFSSFTVSALPNTTVSISVVTSAIDSSQKTVSKDNATYVSQVGVSVQLRSCIIGESQVTDSCVVCPEGKYSLDPTGNCNACPSVATCYGNYTMVPNPGYWRTSYLTDVFWACPYSAACTGSPSGDPLSYTGYCSTGYTGNMCQSCQSGYSRSSTDQCGACPTIAVNTLRLIGIFVLVVVVIVVMVKSTLSSVYRPKAVHSIYIKIFMNYLQLVMLTASFDLQWPEQVLEIFSYQNQAGSVSDQVFSVDCYIANNEKADSKVFFTKLVVMVVAPVVLFVVALIFWLGYSYFKQNYTFLQNELVATSVILFFLIHPTLIKSLFNAFNCKQINTGEYWLVTNLDIRCFTSDYIFYSMVIALPGIIVWGIGTPAVCLGVIWKNRMILQKLHMKLRYGFLYNGYELDRYYWEFVILYRKIAIICCSVFLATISIPVQALTVLLVLIIFLYLQSAHRPYFSPELNLMELRSIMVATTTIYCGLFYLTDALGNDAKLFFFALIVVANAYFLILWIRSMLNVGVSFLEKSVPWVKKIRMMPELDGLEVDNLVNERYQNPYIYKRGRTTMFTLIKQTDPEIVIKRQTTLALDARTDKYRDVQTQLEDMKYIYLSHMEEVLRREEEASDFTVTPRSPPVEEEEKVPDLVLDPEVSKTDKRLLHTSFDQD